VASCVTACWRRRWLYEGNVTPYAGTADRPTCMRTLLNALQGLSIRGVTQLHGYLQLHFDQHTGLSIYNQYDMIPQPEHIEYMIGKILNSAGEQEGSVTLRFIDGTRITVDMRPDAYDGPEAMELNRRGFPPVIWN
jgi:hypothetical protein